MGYIFTIVCTKTIKERSFIVWQVEYYTSYLEVMKYITLLSTIKFFLKLLYKYKEIKNSAHEFSNLPAL